MPRVLISGANRGLGLEFSRQYAADRWEIVAACRNPHDATQLKALGKAVSIFALDVAHEQSIAEFLSAVSDIPIDVVILNAGISAPPQTAAALTRDAWVSAIVVNALAPLRLATGLCANLQNGRQKKAVAIS